MSSERKILKRALRLYRDGQPNLALLELNALIEDNRMLWAAYLLRGKVHQSMSKYPKAIGDYMRALSESVSLSKHNRLQALQNIVLCSVRLSQMQKMELASIFTDDLKVMQNYNKSDVGPLLGLEIAQAVGALRRAAQPKVTLTPAPGGWTLKAPVSEGRIANIGKFLLDAKDLQKINDILSARPPKSGVRTLTTYASANAKPASKSSIKAMAKASGKPASKSSIKAMAKASEKPPTDGKKKPAKKSRSK